MRDRSPDEVIGLRLATQRLTGPPMADPVDAVRQLLCAQAQDGPLARYSLGLRTAGAGDAAVRSVIDEGRVVRTHLLRPTWHFVAAEDLRWILDLTSPKVESSLAGRSRQLDVDDALVDRVHQELVAMLGGRRFATASELIDRLDESGLSLSSEAVRHLLLLAELRGLICSGPSPGSTHAYGLVDELIEPSPVLDRAEAAHRLVHRFFSGHGPASEQDLRRWTTLTLAEIRAALSDLDGVLETVICEGITLWFEPGATAPGSPRRRAALLPTFDEAFLPYNSVTPSRVDGHPRGEEPHAFAEAGGGVVIVDNRDAGWWKRTLRGKRAMTIKLGLSAGLDAGQRTMITEEAEDLAAFFDRDAEVENVEP